MRAGITRLLLGFSGRVLRGWERYLVKPFGFLEMYTLVH
jgi:hypothetical protein